MKNSFVLYTDYIEHIKLLTNEQKGILLQAIFDYEINNDVTIADPVINMAFSFIKTNLDRDRVKYEEIVEKRRNAGLKGGVAKASKSKHKLVSASKSKQSPANVADTVTDTVTDTDIYKYFKDDKELDDTFQKFIKMRKQIKKPMTDDAITLTIQKLEKLSGGNRSKKIEILNNSISNSWQGIYELKENKNKATNFDQRNNDLDERTFKKLKEELGL